MGCGKACNHGGPQHAAENLEGSHDLGGAGAAFRRLAHFGLLVQRGYFTN
jgi:hypothetical protein